MKIIWIALILIACFQMVNGQPMNMKNDNLISEASPLSSMDWNPSTDLQSLFFFSSESMSFPGRKASCLVVLILVDTFRCVLQLLSSRPTSENNFMKQ